MASCPSSSKYFQLKRPCPSRHTLTRYRIRVGHRSQSREELMLRPSQDFYCCFYPSHARLQPKAKSRPYNSQFSCAWSYAGDTCWQLSLSEQPMPGKFLQASSWALFTQPRTIHICHFLIWLSESLRSSAGQLPSYLSSTLREFFCNKPMSHSIRICLSSFLDGQRPREVRDLPKVTQVVSVSLAWCLGFLIHSPGLLKFVPAFPHIWPMSQPWVG